MREQIFARAGDVPGRLWDGIAPADFFFQREFLRVMEASAVENASYRYLVLLEGGEPVGLAVCSGFTLKLDLLADDAWIRRARRWLPGLLDVPIVCCGIPASFGQHHLHLVRPEYRAEAVRRVHRYMEAWAEESHAGALIWKEWSADQGVRELVANEDYVALPTLPDHIVSRLPARIESFLASMRSSYRRKYRTAAALMADRGPVWAREGLRVEVGRYTRDHAKHFHTGYEQLMARTRVRLETYPETFFVNLAESAVDVRRMHLVREESGQSLTALLIPSGSTLQFALVSKPQDRYEDALYTVLLQCIVLYAVHLGFQEVRLGQTSTYTKMSIGARLRRLETFIRMRSPLAHQVLKRFGGMLFPESNVPTLRVFRRGDRADATSAPGLTAGGLHNA